MLFCKLLFSNSDVWEIFRCWEIQIYLNILKLVHSTVKFTPHLDFLWRSLQAVSIQKRGITESTAMGISLFWIISNSRKICKNLALPYTFPPTSPHVTSLHNSSYWNQETDTEAAALTNPDPSGTSPVFLPNVLFFWSGIQSRRTHCIL